MPLGSLNRITGEQSIPQIYGAQGTGLMAPLKLPTATWPGVPLAPEAPGIGKMITEEEGSGNVLQLMATVGPVAMLIAFGAFMAHRNR